MTGAAARIRAEFTRERQILALIVVVGVALTSAHLASAQPGGYYATAVRSMSGSWHAWFFGALDPGSTISVDKVPGWLQLQAVFVRVLGFHGWVIELPQVLAGGVSVIALYVAIRRWRGVAAARAAAVLFVLTPIVTPTFAHSMEDGPLACCLILALDRAHKAAVAGRLRPLVASALWIAAGFEAKMTAAWVILPAVLVAYGCLAPISRRARLVHGTIATLTCVALSSVWVVIVALVPAGSRPYVDGTSNDNIATMVFGYNGVGRFGIHLPGSLPQLTSLIPTSYVPGAGWAKLLHGHLAPQIAWLLPLAAVALVVGWRSRRGDRAGYVLWGGAWLSWVLALSAAGRLPHTAYVVALAAPTAALAGPFLLDLVHSSRRMIAAVVLAQASWTAWIWTVEPSFAVWLRWGSVAVALLVVVNLRRSVGRVVLASGVAAAVLIGPVTWTLSTVNPAYAGSDMDAVAGPPGPTYPGEATPAQVEMFGAEGADFASPGPTLTGDAADVWQLAKQRQGSAYHPLTTVGWYLAQPFILATGEPVLPTGGFSRLVSAPSLVRFQELVGSGQVRMVLVGGGALRGAIQDGSANNDIVHWVVANCVVVKTWPYPRSGTVSAGLELLDCATAGSHPALVTRPLPAP